MEKSKPIEMDAEECEKLVRAVMNSSTERFSLRRLSADFLELVGVEIPYKQLGFRSLSKYLNSLYILVEIHDTRGFLKQAIKNKLTFREKKKQRFWFGKFTIN